MSVTFMGENQKSESEKELIRRDDKNANKHACSAANRAMFRSRNLK